MHAELQTEYPNLNIPILAINMIGTEPGVEDVALISNLPIVQDDASLTIWDNWGGIWRDVKILNAQNEVIHTFNLTQHNLAPGNGFCTDSVSMTQSSCEGLGETWFGNYEYLKQLFVDAATQ
jgi:hypothetical protein